MIERGDKVTLMRAKGHVWQGTVSDVSEARGKLVVQTRAGTSTWESTLLLSDEGIWWAHGWGDDVTAVLRASHNLSADTPRVPEGGALETFMKKTFQKFQQQQTQGALEPYREKP